MNFQNSLVPILLLLLVLIILPCTSVTSNSRRKSGNGQVVEKYGERREQGERDRPSRRSSKHREKSGQRRKNSRRRRNHEDDDEDGQLHALDKYKYNRNHDEGISRRDGDRRRPSGNRETSSRGRQIERSRKSHGKQVVASKRYERRSSSRTERRSKAMERRRGGGGRDEGKRSGNERKDNDEGKRREGNEGERRHRHSSNHRERRRGSSQRERSHNRREDKSVSKSKTHKSKMKDNADVDDLYNKFEKLKINGDEGNPLAAVRSRIVSKARSREISGTTSKQNERRRSRSRKPAENQNGGRLSQTRREERSKDRGNVKRFDSSASRKHRSHSRSSEGIWGRRSNSRSISCGRTERLYSKTNDYRRRKNYRTQTGGGGKVDEQKGANANIGSESATRKHGKEAIKGGGEEQEDTKRQKSNPKSGTETEAGGSSQPKIGREKCECGQHFRDAQAKQKINEEHYDTVVRFDSGDEGDVDHAFSLSRNKCVAIKFCEQLMDAELESESAWGCHREIEVMTAANNANKRHIVQMFDHQIHRKVDCKKIRHFGITKCDQYYMVMELGKISLQNLIIMHAESRRDPHRTIPIPIYNLSVEQIMRDVRAGVRELHSLGFGRVDGHDGNAVIFKKEDGSETYSIKIIDFNNVFDIRYDQDFEQNKKDENNDIDAIEIALLTVGTNF